MQWWSSTAGAMWWGPCYCSWPPAAVAAEVQAAGGGWRWRVEGQSGSG